MHTRILDMRKLPGDWCYIFSLELLYSTNFSLEISFAQWVRPASVALEAEDKDVSLLTHEIGKGFRLSWDVYGKGWDVPPTTIWEECFQPLSDLN